MAQKQVAKPVALAVGAALAGTFAVTGAAIADTGVSPFSMTTLSAGYLLGLAEDAGGGDKEAKETEGSCGEATNEGEATEAEGSCGGDKEGANEAEGSAVVAIRKVPRKLRVPAAATRKLRVLVVAIRKVPRKLKAAVAVTRKLRVPVVAIKKAPRKLKAPVAATKKLKVLVVAIRKAPRKLRVPVVAIRKAQPKKMPKVNVVKANAVETKKARFPVFA